MKRESSRLKLFRIINKIFNSPFYIFNFFFISHTLYHKKYYNNYFKYISNNTLSKQIHYCNSKLAPNSRWRLSHGHSSLLLGDIPFGENIYLVYKKRARFSVCLYSCHVAFSLSDKWQGKIFSTSCLKPCLKHSLAFGIGPFLFFLISTLASSHLEQLRDPWKQYQKLQPAARILPWK